jgi:hypothetical protein
MSSQLKDKMEWQDFSDINQVLQKALVYENRAKGSKSYGRFKKVSNKDKSSINYVSDDMTSDEEIGMCVVEWVDACRCFLHW